MMKRVASRILGSQATKKNFSSALMIHHQPQQNCYSSSARNVKPTVTIFGGSGFVGQQILKRIAPQCEKVIIACRGVSEFEHQARHYDNVSVVYSDVTDKDTIDSAIYGSDVVINLVGLLYESDNTFVEAHIDGASNVSHSAHRLGVDQMIQFSFLNSELDSPSWWSDTRYRSEDIVYSNFPTATFVKPSIMFDKKENIYSGAYINRLGRTPLRFLPVIPAPLHDAKLQPVFVNDVIDAVEKVIFSKVEETRGKSLYLAGPEVMTLQQMMSKAFGKPALPVWYPVFDFILGCTQMLPNPVVTRDQFLVLKQHGGDLTLNSTLERIEPSVKRTIMTFEDLDIQPKSLTSQY
ncbi:hypothetical protein FDP41_012965 [Naegleria fowleri]|uniref:NmrA-like domain-containing protein n=1 Tax=Naegleria fowleri TaxID=5763 RepID=A0A6A5C5G2_NAEFO|nr:uncharacterized protein FDP41_013351 [Naegleria fowleri]XP_044565890.1 uncharacterized protein FDP41_012965 [Naegleria fowleri]KAF0980569.1 hypothetical protein FDP41_013351 [Naegleria fowleri]KAF0981177.1 hypothetical protein FDP41_012965 [Naegleria fowleri]